MERGPVLYLIPGESSMWEIDGFSIWLLGLTEGSCKGVSDVRVDEVRWGRVNGVTGDMHCLQDVGRLVFVKQR